MNPAVKDLHNNALNAKVVAKELNTASRTQFQEDGP